MHTDTFHVDGMTSGRCVQRVTDALQSVSGVRNVQVTFSSGDAAVEFDEALCTEAQLVSAVRYAGYGTDGLSIVSMESPYTSALGLW